MVFRKRYRGNVPGGGPNDLNAAFVLSALVAGRTESGVGFIMRRSLPLRNQAVLESRGTATPAQALCMYSEKQKKAGPKGTGFMFGRGGSLPTLFCFDYSDGYSLKRAALEDGQRAADRALTTFGAGFCIACQRS